ncbi:MAG: alpha-amylase/4-alpha-glucanotransferase domain-containing protein, partial [Candidatus Odinarchaeota archaeon]
NERNPVRITKDIYVENDEIKITIRFNINEIPEKKEILNRIVKNLNMAIDIPFFFNGDTNKFQWENKQGDLAYAKDSKLLESIQYNGTYFRAYDESYDLNFELNISSNDSIKINKFPIIAYAFTDEGYQEIYQGINIVPSVKLDKNLEIHLNFKIF